LKIASTPAPATPYGRRPLSSTPKTTTKKLTIYFKDGQFNKVSSFGSATPNRQTWKLYKEIEAEISRIEKEIDLRDTTRVVEEESIGKSVMGSKMASIIKQGKQSDNKD